MMTLIGLQVFQEYYETFIIKSSVQRSKTPDTVTLKDFSLFTPTQPIRCTLHGLLSTTIFSTIPVVSDTTFGPGLAPLQT